MQMVPEGRRNLESYPHRLSCFGSTERKTWVNTFCNPKIVDMTREDLLHFQGSGCPKLSLRMQQRVYKQTERQPRYFVAWNMIKKAPYIL